MKGALAALAAQLGEAGAAAADGLGETASLARFALGLSWDHMSSAAADEVGRSFVNAFGCMVGGSRHEMVELAEATLKPFAGPSTAPVVGRGWQTDALTAALLNGVSGAAYSYDDAYGEAMLHPGGPILSALLSLAHRGPVDGVTLLVAYAAGLETACRLTKALTVPPAQAELAWSQTGVVAGVGAAVATGRLLGLHEAAMTSAIGIAASEAAGSRATHGSMAATLIFGHSAQTGLRAALLAEKGFTSTPGAIEHKFGIASLFARNANLPAVTEGLGKQFEFLSMTYKPYPCGLVIHPVLDGVIKLRREAGFSGPDIQRIVLRVAPAAILFGWNPDPRNELEAKVSLPHWAAVAALTGRAGLAQGRAEIVHDAAVRALRARVDGIGDAAIAIGQAEVQIDIVGGPPLHVRIEHCSGSPRRPMTNGELSEKFLGQAEGVLGTARARDALETAWRLPELSDLRELIRLAC